MLLYVFTGDLRADKEYLHTTWGQYVESQATSSVGLPTI